MARIDNAVLDKAPGNVEETHKMIDATYGGQDGYMQNLGKDGKFSEWINNTAYVKRNVIPFVLQVPKFFKYMDDAKKLEGLLISVLETRCEKIDGLTSTVTLETDEHIIGAAGEMQEEAVRSQRARSTLTTSLRELEGLPINALLDLWITYGIMDPDTQRPKVTSLSSYDKDKTDVYTPDQYTMSMLFIEPDFSHRNVVKAYALTNMMPKSAGEITAGRDLSAAGEMSLYDIEWTSITVSNLQTRIYAQTLLDELTILKTDPNTVPLFLDDRDTAVKTATRTFNTPIKE